MLRLIGGTILGVVAWIVVVSVLNLVPRHGWADYAAVEKAMTFTLSLLVMRLSMSGIASIVSGALAGLVDRTGRAPLASGVILLLLFVPEHYMLWRYFPVWYHLTFLASLPILGWAGGKIVRLRPAAG